MTTNTLLALEADESILRTVHRHWITLLPPMVALGILAALPLFVASILLTLEAESTVSTIPWSLLAPYLFFLYPLWLLVLWLSLAHTLMGHFLDSWTVTTKRIIFIDQNGFFRRHVGSLPLARVQDINLEVNGIFATFLNYGTIEVETASGSEGEFRAHHLPDPQGLKQLILETSKTEAVQPPQQ